MQFENRIEADILVRRNALLWPYLGLQARQRVSPAECARLGLTGQDLVRICQPGFGKVLNLPRPLNLIAFFLVLIRQGNCSFQVGECISFRPDHIISLRDLLGLQAQQQT